MPGRECQCCGHFDAELCLALKSGWMPRSGPGTSRSRTKSLLVSLSEERAGAGCRLDRAKATCTLCGMGQGSWRLWRFNSVERLGQV